MGKISGDYRLSTKSWLVCGVGSSGLEKKYGGGFEMVGSLGELQNVRCCFASDLRSERSGLNEKH